ncbi:MAG TPA: GNAT family N-acetyltransferase, partial [Candidatus Caenarcaniphilales bacterium]
LLPKITFRSATPADDPLIAQHFHQMWLDNQVPVECLQPNWLAQTLQFIAQARQNLGYQAFLSEVHAQIVGSVSAQRFTGLYPVIFTPSYRQDGYIWGVYVEPVYREQGIATELTRLAIEHLKTLGCTRAVLNASPSGRPVYEKLGFGSNNAMTLSL